LAEYTITVSSGVTNDRDSTLTTVRVDTTAGTPRITEVTIRPGSGEGLTPDLLPAVDLEQLVRAFFPENAFLAAISTDAVPAAFPPADRTSSQQTSQTVSEPIEPMPSEDSVITVTAKSDQPSSGRPYRRMPEVATVLAALEAAGSVTAMAKQLGVPTHTAKDWMRRIRKKGLN